MKKIFEEPKMNLEQFAVIDQTMTISFVTANAQNDELNPYGIPAIG